MINLCARITEQWRYAGYCPESDANGDDDARGDGDALAEDPDGGDDTLVDPDCPAATPTDPGTPTPTAATGDDDGAGGESPVLVGVGGLVVVGAAVLTIREVRR